MKPDNEVVFIAEIKMNGASFERSSPPKVCQTCAGVIVLFKVIRTHCMHLLRMYSTYRVEYTII